MLYKEENKDKYLSTYEEIKERELQEGIVVPQLWLEAMASRQFRAQNHPFPEKELLIYMLHGGVPSFEYVAKAAALTDRPELAYGAKESPIAYLLSCTDEQLDKLNHPEGSAQARVDLLQTLLPKVKSDVETSLLVQKVYAETEIDAPGEYPHRAGLIKFAARHGFTSDESASNRMSALDLVERYADAQTLAQEIEMQPHRMSKHPTTDALVLHLIKQGAVTNALPWANEKGSHLTYQWDETDKMWPATLMSVPSSSVGMLTANLAKHLGEQINDLHKIGRYAEGNTDLKDVLYKDFRNKDSFLFSENVKSSALALAAATGNQEAFNSLLLIGADPSGIHLTGERDYQNDLKQLISAIPDQELVATFTNALELVEQRDVLREQMKESPANKMHPS